jgi:hypothetical protein
MSTPATSAGAPTEFPPLSEAERVVDTFVAPTKIFTDIRRNASWWVPWLLISIFGLAMVYVVDKKVGFDRAAENQVQLSPKATARLEQLTPEQRAQQMELSAKLTGRIAYASPVLTIVIAAVFAGVLLATFNFGLGAELKFSQCLAISMYAFLPGIIKAVLVIVSILIGGGENFSFQNQLASNLGFLFDPNSSHFLHSIASSIDLFNMWTLVLTGIGYSCLTRVKRGTCMGVVFGWWAVVTLVGAAVGSLFG